MMMFTDNLKILRKAKGFTQEELAIKLNVVRQTISKWEKGISVPDADMLIRIAGVFEVSVGELLGAKLDNEADINIVAEQLSRINEQLAIKNRRSHRIWKTIVIVLVTIVIINIAIVIMGIVSYHAFSIQKNSSVTTEENITLHPLSE
jgi:putative transcriptional regulator